jgi:hypothetical protein
MESFIDYYKSMKIRGVVSPNLQGWDPPPTYMNAYDANFRSACIRTSQKFPIKHLLHQNYQHCHSNCHQMHCLHEKGRLPPIAAIGHLYWGEEDHNIPE